MLKDLCREEIALDILLADSTTIKLLQPRVFSAFFTVVSRLTKKKKGNERLRVNQKNSFKRSFKNASTRSSLLKQALVVYSMALPTFYTPFVVSSNSSNPIEIFCTLLPCFWFCLCKSIKVPFEDLYVCSLQILKYRKRHRPFNIFAKFCPTPTYLYLEKCIYPVKSMSCLFFFNNRLRHG